MDVRVIKILALLATLHSPTLHALHTMLQHHADETTLALAVAIDRYCDDTDCRLDAIATCWVETRCIGTHCGNNGCGPYQQLRRYADHPTLAGLSYAEKSEILKIDARVATEQWGMKRAWFKHRYGSEWPKHYNGSENRKRYLTNWNKARKWAGGILNTR